MAYPTDAGVVILYGSWFDEATRTGINATITATPLPAGSNSNSNSTVHTPNLTDVANFAWIKSRTWSTTPLASGMYALPLIANDDPDLTAFGGYRISPQGETPFIVNVSVTAPTVTVTQEMSDAIAQCASQSGSSFTVPAGSTVQAVHLTEAAVLSSPAPQPPSAYLTEAQTNSVIASALAAFSGGALVPTAVFTSGSHTPISGEMAIYNPSSNITVTLPAAASGQRFGVSNVSSGNSTVTLNRAGSDTFSAGGTTLVLGPGERAVLLGKSGGFTLESRTHSAALVQWAANPDALIVGTITRDANGAATSAPVVWPDGTVGTYTATTISNSFPGAVDAYTITYGSPTAKTYTQSAVTRNASGAVTARPAITAA